MPRLWRILSNRLLRLVLLVLVAGIAIDIVKEIHEGAEPPTAVFAAPKVPEINPNLKIITVQAPRPRRCWLANYFGMPNSKIAGAVTATTAILHCSTRVEAPFRVVVEFD